MGDAVDTRSKSAGREDCFGEILQSVAGSHFEGTHRAGENDGTGWFWEPCVQVFTSVAQRVGAVENDDALGRCTHADFDGFGDGVAIVFGHEEAVLAHEFDDVDACISQTQPAEHAIQNAAAVFERAGGLVVGLFDCAAGGDDGEGAHEELGRKCERAKGAKGAKVRR